MRPSAQPGCGNAEVIFRGLGSADSGRLRRRPGTPIRPTRGNGMPVRRRRSVRHGPTNERFEGNSASRRPTMRVVRVRSVAVRPRALVDRQAAVPMTGLKRPMLGRLADPVDYVSSRQIRPPPTLAPKPICYGRTTGPLRHAFVITALHRRPLIASRLYYSAALAISPCALNR